MGTSFSENEIKNELENKFINKVNYRKIDNNNEKYNIATDLIINKSVIGWFQGKMEFGPRALGNRSILADPRNPKIKELINLKIKRREKILDHLHHLFYQNYKKNGIKRNLITCICQV